MSLPQSVRDDAAAIERYLGALFDDMNGPADRLAGSMRYATMNGGKRLRACLVLAAARLAAGGSLPEGAMAVAASVECLHAYSLVHDDLPAMDDSDTRRGEPSCHIAFDEATAILAGDALQALAFEILAKDAVLSRSPRQQVEIILGLARACGANGMAGGQVMDLASLGQEIDQEELEEIHKFKTGELIEFSAVAPALLSSAAPNHQRALARYGKFTGLAFQVFDDVLDVTGNSKKTGKPSQADAARSKPAFPAIIGVRKSKERARE